MLRATGYLWIVAAYAVYYGYVNTAEPAQDFLLSVVQLWDPPPSYAGMGAWSILAFLFSAMYALWHWRKWRGETWLSLLTWSCVLGAFVGWSTTVEWMPRATNYFEYYDIHDKWYAALGGWPAQLLDLATWIAVSLFMLILLLHSRNDERLPIGGRWRPVWAVVLGGFLAVLLSFFNPIDTIAILSRDFPMEVRDPTLLSLLGDLFVAWATIVLPLACAFGVMAWKTRASLSVSDDKMTIGLGRELGLFSVRWKKVLSATEIVESGERRSVIFEHGALPWYRLRFGLYLRRDGAGALEQVWRYTPNKRRTELRRGTKLAGYLFLAASAVCIAIIEWTTHKSSYLMANSKDEFIQSYVGADHFLLFGWLTMGVGLFLGLGLGMLFTQNYARVSALPLLGVALAAIHLPDPVIHWLVYIALYAILAARLGPVDPVPHVPFPDLRVAEFGFWAADARVSIAVICYVIGTMIVLKPWTRFLPSWPYRLQVFGDRSEDAPELSDPDQSTVASTQEPWR